MRSLTMVQLWQRLLAALELGCAKTSSERRPEQRGVEL
jgi:hypothetical protein